VTGVREAYALIPGLIGCFDPTGGLDDRVVRRLESAFGDAGSKTWADAHVAVSWYGISADGDEHALIAVDGDLASAAASRRAPAGPSPDDVRWLTNGFAGIEWDGARRSGLLIRDPSGAKEIYLLRDGDRLIFTTDLALLLRMDGCRLEPDMQVLSRWLANAPLGLGRTLFASVSVLPPGYRLTIDAHGWRAGRYWAPRIVSRTQLTGDDAVAALTEGIAKVVGTLMSGSRTPAVRLSGGLDSGTVLAHAARVARGNGAHRPTGFYGVFEDYPDLDEGRYVTAMADAAGVNAERVGLRPGGLVAGCRAFVTRTGLPPRYPGGRMFAPLVAEVEARQHDLLLDGEGGDELFGAQPFAVGDAVRTGRLATALYMVREAPFTGPGVPVFLLRMALRRWIVEPMLPLGIATRLDQPEQIGPPWLRDRPIALGHRTWPRRVPLWRSKLAWALTSGRDANGVFEHLAASDRVMNIRSGRPFMCAALTELVLSIAPQEAFDHRFDRALQRRAGCGLLADEVRLRQGKTTFNQPLLDGLVGADRDAIERRLGADVLAVSPLVDPVALRAALRKAQDLSDLRSMLALWRVYAAEEWLVALSEMRRR
jgi:asparagine synthetase B (glutamine-hydrolysing)